eukprot:1841432-Lingulodinium_polyedra.AAC.1
MLAPPCRTWGTAICRSYVLRSKGSPWGLDAAVAKAPVHIQARFADGNAAMAVALELMAALHEKCIPWAFEHPVGSYVFHTREMRNL